MERFRSYHCLVIFVSESVSDSYFEISIGCRCCDMEHILTHLALVLTVSEILVPEYVGNINADEHLNSFPFSVTLIFQSLPQFQTFIMTAFSISQRA